MKKFGIHLTVLVLLLGFGGIFSTPSVSAQNRKVKKLLKKADQSTNHDEAHMLHFDAQWLAEELGDDAGLAEAYFRHALYYHSLANSSLGDHFLELSMRYYRSQGNLDKIAELQREYDLQELGYQDEQLQNEFQENMIQQNLEESTISISIDNFEWDFEEEVSAPKEQLSVVQIIAGFIMIFSLLAVVYFRRQWKKTIDENKI